LNAVRHALLSVSRRGDARVAPPHLVCVEKFTLPLTLGLAAGPGGKVLAGEVPHSDL